MGKRLGKMLYAKNKSSGGKILFLHSIGDKSVVYYLYLLMKKK